MKRYILNEGVNVRRLFGLNESAKPVTVQDIKIAFDEAAKLYGGMTLVEAMTKCRKEKRYVERFWSIALDNPDEIYDMDDDFAYLRDLVDRYKGGKGKTKQTLYAYFNRGDVHWPDIYEMGDHSKESQAARYISEKLDCYVCIMTEDYDFGQGNTPQNCYEGNSGIIDAWYRGIPVGIIAEGDLERMEAEIRAGKNPGAYKA